MAAKILGWPTRAQRAKRARLLAQAQRIRTARTKGQRPDRLAHALAWAKAFTTSQTS